MTEADHSSAGPKKLEFLAPGRREFRVLFYSLITPGKFPEARFDFIIPSKEGIQFVILDARFHGHDRLAGYPAASCGDRGRLGKTPPFPSRPAGEGKGEGE
jgi:hypothetical protein